jgi:hypothetical protein
MTTDVSGWLRSRHSGSREDIKSWEGSSIRPSQIELAKIISGGQTGIDRGALDAALTWGFLCGGWCPLGRLAEDSRIPEHYPLIELKEGGYSQRTLRNVLESDGTAILYFSLIKGGTEETLLFCIKKHKPYKLIDAEEISAERAALLLASFVRHYGIEVLNVAGPRQSQAPHAHAYAYAAINSLL